MVVCEYEIFWYSDIQMCQDITYMVCYCLFESEDYWLSVLMCESLHSNCLYIWALWGCWYVETLTRLLGNDRTGTWQIFMSRGVCPGVLPSTHQNIQNPTGLVILGRGINIRLVKIMWEASRWLQLYIKQKFQRISHCGETCEDWAREENIFPQTISELYVDTRQPYFLKLFTVSPPFNQNMLIPVAAPIFVLWSVG